MKKFIARCIAAVALTAGLFVHAEPVWTDGSWTVETVPLTPPEQNIILGKAVSLTGSYGSESFNNLSVLTDGAISDTRTKDTVVAISSNAKLSWTFDDVMVVRGVRIFSQWAGTARVNVHVLSITGKDANGAAVTIFSGDHNYDGGKEREYSTFADSEGARLGVVKSITIEFGTLENGYCGYSEIEVIGEKAFGEVKVTGVPQDFGQVEPPYGAFYGTPGKTSVFTAPDSSETEDSKFTCTGWKLFDAADGLVRDSETGCGEGESATCCKIPYQTETLRLEWQWATEYKVAPTADDPTKGGVEVSDPLAAYGAEVTLTPVPNEGFAFHHWVGLPADADIWTAEQTLMVTGPLNPTAVFGRAVAPSDGAGLAAAVTDAEDLDVITLAKGTYTIDARLEIAKSVRLEGATGDPSDVVIDAQKSCKVVSIANELARLSRLTVANGYTTASSDKGGGIYMTAGIVKGCVIRDCTLIGNSSKGGGIYMTGEKTLVEDTLVAQCAAGRQGGACGIYNSNGTIRRTEIAGCYPVSSSTVYGPNIFSAIGLEQVGNAALAENCVIRDNVAVYSHKSFTNVGGLLLSGGEVRSTLVVGNSTGQDNETGSNAAAPGGVYVNGGQLVNCTVAGNRTTRATSAGGIHLSSGTVENCLIVDNVNAGSVEAVADLVGGDKGTWLNNAVRGVEAVTVGSGNFEADEVPFAPGGYELAVGSSCAGAGKVEEWMADATDLAGVSRLREVGGVEVVDIGAYAVAPAGKVTVLGTPAEVGDVSPDYGVSYAADGQPTVCTAPETVLTALFRYTCAGWKLADAMGTPVRDSETGCGPDEGATRCVIPFGDVPMRLEWQWASEYAVAPTCDEERGSVAVDKAFAPRGGSVMLTATAKDGFAFHHWENVPAGTDVWKATTTVTVTEPLAPLAVFGRAVSVGDTAGLLAAVAEPEGFDVIVLAKGTYAVDARLEIGTNVRLNGATGNPADVIIDAQEKCKVVSLANEYACLAFLTVANGRGTDGSYYDPGFGAGVYMTSGAVVGCVVRDCVHAGTGSYGGGIYMTGAKTLVEDTVVTHCAVGRRGGGSGIRNVGGTIRRTTISGCYPYKSDENSPNMYTVLGLDQSGASALAENCIISDNVATYNHGSSICAGGVYLTGGEVRNTLIVGNGAGTRNEGSTTTGAPGGVYLDGGRLVNCTVVGNTATREQAAGGVQVVSGTIENCLVVDNVFKVTEGTGRDVTGGDKGTWLNNAVRDVAAVTVGSGNFEADEVPFALDGYELAVGSTCAGAGKVESWMTGATDLAGVSRLREVGGVEVVDVGCYSVAPAGKVTVLGAPVEVGDVSPDYGVSYAADGQPTVCTAPEVVMTATIKYLCAGWKLADAMGTPVRDSETGCAADESATRCVIPFSDVPMRLMWSWACEFGVTPTCDAEKGLVAVDKSFVSRGGSVTLTATAKDGFAFHHWENVPAGTDVWKATTTVTVAEPLAPLAVFGRAVPVGDTAGLLAAVAEPEGFDVIVLAKGTYAVDARLEIGTNVRLNGATGNPADVIIDAQKKCKVVSLANEYACLSSLTVANGYATEGSVYARDLGAGVYMTAGAVVGCIVCDCVHVGTGSLGGGIYMTGTKTLVEDSVVTHCAAGRQGGACGVCNVNGTIRRTKIINCYPTTNMMTANIYTAVGLDQSGADALTENCIVTNNVAGNSHKGNNNVGGVNLTGGVVRNTLIAGNSTGLENESGSATVAPGGVWVNGGSLVNCTVLGNASSRAASAGGVHLSSGSVVNCVIWGNVLTGGEAPVVSNWTGADANFTYCLTTPALSDPNSLSETPKLRGGRLLPSSAGVDAGCNEGWMTGATDLRGNPRIVRDRVDMGAYESLQQGLFLLVR